MSANPSFELLGPLSPIRGLSLGVAEAGIKQANHRDLSLIKLDEGTKVSGVFTQNKFCAAPVKVAKEHILR
jgi:glutamate N-acetyltransferase/amino-acid N-acetyltransferase